MKQLTSTTTTHYNQPIYNNLTSSCTKLHPLLQHTTAAYIQPNTNHITRTHTQAPSTDYRSFKHRSTLTTTHSTTHPQYHTPFQTTNKTKIPHTHPEYKHIFTHHANNNNQVTKPCIATLHNHHNKPLTKYIRNVTKPIPYTPNTQSHHYHIVCHDYFTNRSTLTLSPHNTM